MANFEMWLVGARAKMLAPCDLQLQFGLHSCGALGQRRVESELHMPLLEPQRLPMEDSTSRQMRLSN